MNLIARESIPHSRVGSACLLFSIFPLACVVVYTCKMSAGQFLGMIVIEADGACYYDSSYLQCWMDSEP